MTDEGKIAEDTRLPESEALNDFDGSSGRTLHGVSVGHSRLLIYVKSFFRPN